MVARLNAAEGKTREGGERGAATDAEAAAAAANSAIGWLGRVLHYRQ